MIAFFGFFFFILPCLLAAMFINPAFGIAVVCLGIMEIIIIRSAYVYGHKDTKK